MWGEGLVFLWRLDGEEGGILRDAGDFSAVLVLFVIVGAVFEVVEFGEGGA